MRRLAVLAFGLILACLTAGSSYADQIGYTLDASVNFSPTGASGTVDPFAGFLDEADAICLAGTCDLEAPQDWLVVTVTVTSGSVNDVGFGALFANAVGVGYFTQGGLPQDGTSGQDTYTGSIANPSVPVITFLANGGGAGLTGTSDRKSVV